MDMVACLLSTLQFDFFMVLRIGVHDYNSRKGDALVLEEISITFSHGMESV